MEAAAHRGQKITLGTFIFVATCSVQDMKGSVTMHVMGGNEYLPSSPVALLLRRSCSNAGLNFCSASIYSPRLEVRPWSGGKPSGIDRNRIFQPSLL
jgi:hypothetical protein